MSFNESLIDDLQVLGLTLNEAKVLSTLVRLGSSATVTLISKHSDVPRNKIYQALTGLETKGIVAVDEIKGSGNVYRLLFEDSKSIISHLQNLILDPIEIAAKRSTKSLASIAKTIEELEAIHEVWVIKGADNIVRTAKEIIDSANILIISNLYPEFIEPLISNIIKAKVERDVMLKLVMLDEETEELGNVVSLDQISDEITGISIAKFKSMIDNLPFEDLQEKFTSILSLFHHFLDNRPNFLMIDPDSENANAFLIFTSTTNPPYSSAIQTQNKEFINSFHFLMNLIWELVDNLLSLQNPSLDLA
ncbi:MAG: TrmB family transcriptional regulator [Promethearchaeota archaeon]